MIAMAVMFALAALLFAWGIALMCGKAFFAASGYYDTDADKAKIYETALCRFIGKGMFGLTLPVCMLALGIGLNMPWLFLSGLALFSGVFLFVFIYLYKSSKFSIG